MAASVFCCFSCCRDGGAGHIPLKEMPAVHLDTQRMGERGRAAAAGGRLPGGQGRSPGARHGATAGKVALGLLL